MTDNSVITVVEENRIRGTIESVYQLNKNDSRKDTYMMTSCTLTLTDDEFSSFLAEINEVAAKYMSKPVTEKSVSRQLSMVSSPVN